MNIKVGILFVNLGPYHLARIEACVTMFQKIQSQIISIELATSQAVYPWKTQRQDSNFPIISVLTDQSLEKTNIFECLLKLNDVLNKTNPDVLAIAGYSEPSMLFALAWCLWNHKPAILFSDTMESNATRYQGKELIKHWIVGKYKSALVAGQLHKKYLIKQGMSPEEIFLGYDVVDNKTFHPDKIGSLSSPITKPYFLAINRFVTKKNLPSLIASYADYRQQKGNEAWDLVLSGDGELRIQLEKQIDKLGLGKCVHLPGFLQQNELLPYFAHASCFIHASIQEEWGLVVNEAMAAGLPVLVSNRCGCFEDLVIEEVNGFGFDPEDQQMLTQLMLKMSSSQVDLAAMGQQSLQHIQKYSPDYFAQGLMQAVEYSLSHS